MLYVLTHQGDLIPAEQIHVLWALWAAISNNAEDSVVADQPVALRRIGGDSVGAARPPALHIVCVDLLVARDGIDLLHRRARFVLVRLASLNKLAHC